MLNNVPKHQEFLIVSLKHIKNETNIDHIQSRVCLLTSEFVDHQSSLDLVKLGVLVFPYLQTLTVHNSDQPLPGSKTVHTLMLLLVSCPLYPNVRRYNIPSTVNFLFQANKVSLYIVISATGLRIQFHR